MAFEHANIDFPTSMYLESTIIENLLVLRMNNAPVNCFSLSLRREIYDALKPDALRSDIRAIILHGAGRCFSAGGDLRERGSDAAVTAPRLAADVLPAIECSPVPVIAAMHGAAIGGGLELALACHYRVALADTKIALPEVTHGMIPLSGTQRLPRLWGVARAMALMLGPQTLTAHDFAGSAVFDLVFDGVDVLPEAVQFARSLVHPERDPPRLAARLVRNRPFADDDPQAALNAVLRSREDRPSSSAETALIAAVSAGVSNRDFDAAMREAQIIFDRLADDHSKT